MAFTKTIFSNANVYKNAEDNLAQIVIGNPPKNGVRGILLGKVIVRLAAEWDSILSSFGGFENIQNTISKLGFSVGNSGILTRKYFKKGGYLNLAQEFRIVDWDGKHNIIKDANWLLSKCVPNSFGGVSSTEVDPGANNGANKLKGKGPSAWAKNLSSSLGIASSPTPVHVKLSSFFDSSREGHFGRMIITNIAVTYSKEMTKNGPLYADISAELTGLYALDSSRISNLSKQGKTRVSIQ